MAKFTATSRDEVTPSTSYAAPERVATGVITSVRVSPDDYGRLIGREGRTIKAIRSLLFFAGQKHGKRYQLDLIED